jgi:hypothetical protein
MNAAGCQRQQNRHHNQLGNRFLIRLELLQPVPRLQLTEHQLSVVYIQHRDLCPRELARKLRHVSAVVWPLQESHGRQEILDVSEVFGLSSQYLDKRKMVMGELAPLLIRTRRSRRSIDEIMTFGLSIASSSV